MKMIFKEILFCIAVVCLLGNIHGENESCSDIYEFSVQYQADLRAGKLQVCEKSLSKRAILHSGTRQSGGCQIKPKPLELLSKSVNLASQGVSATSSFANKDSTGTRKPEDAAAGVSGALGAVGTYLEIIDASRTKVDEKCEKRNEMLAELGETFEQLNKLQEQLTEFADKFIQKLRKEFDVINAKLDLIIENVDISNRLSFEFKKLSTLEADTSRVELKFLDYLEAPDINLMDYVSECMGAELGIQLHNIYESLTKKEANSLRTLTTARWDIREYLAISLRAGLSFTRGALTLQQCFQVMGYGNPSALVTLVNDAALNSKYLREIRRTVLEESKRITDDYWGSCQQEAHFFILTYQGGAADFPKQIAKHLKNKYPFRDFKVLMFTENIKPKKNHRPHHVLEYFLENRNNPYINMEWREHMIEGEKYWILIISYLTGEFSTNDFDQMNHDFRRCFLSEYFHYMEKIGKRYYGRTFPKELVRIAESCKGLYILFVAHIQRGGESNPRYQVTWGNHVYHNFEYDLFIKVRHQTTSPSGFDYFIYYFSFPQQEF